MGRFVAMTLILGLSSLAGLVPVLGCSAPCKLTPDPDCDRTKTNNHCPYICAEGEGLPSEMSPAAQDEADSGILDGGADG